MNNFYYKDLSSQIQPVKYDPKKRSKHLGLHSSRFKCDKMGSNALEIINDAKKRDRTYLELSEWGKSKYSSTNWCELLKNNCPDEIERLDFEDTSVDFFLQNYEKKNKPCVIKNSTKHLKVDKYWTFN